MASGIDLQNIDSAVRAQNDFYRYVNGMWLDRTEIPSDRSDYGTFTELTDASEKNIKAIVTEMSEKGGEPGTDERKIADFYHAFMDIAHIEALGLDPLGSEFARIDAIKDTGDLVEVFGHLARIGARSPLIYFVDQDLKESTKYLGYFHHGGLGLPDRDYYLKNDDKMAKARSAYEIYLSALSRPIRSAADDRTTEEAVSADPSVFKLETAIAEAHWTRVENRDRDKIYNKRTFAELEKMAPDIDWLRWFKGAHVPQPEAIVVRQPSYLEKLSVLVKTVPLPEWKAYLRLALIDSFADILPQHFMDAHFAFHGKAIRGIEENRPRWKRALEAMDAALGEALGKVYVARHFKPEAKARMQVLVGNLERAFHEGIDDLEWMTDATKVQAKAKLGKFVSKIGYPDVWRDYSALEIDPRDPVGNATRANAFEHDRRVELLGKPIDRKEWFMTPHTVNAYYNPSMNEVVFPAAILQPPFFNADADDAVNYGAIGAVIGHELSHGFDDQGRKSDGDGNLRDWWTEQDAREFKARAQLMIDQYAGYEALPGKTLNGELTIGENIGDLGGLTIAYRAYKLSLDGREAPIIEGLTGDQRFFMGWAQIWRRKYRDAELERRLVIDPHAPSRFRVIGVLSNMPEFYEAFGIEPEDGMFRPAEKRVKIW